MTLIELMVAAGVLVITSVGGYSGFLLLNRQAANMRNLSMARALCQERIEQALTLGFRPGASTPVVPAAPAFQATAPGATPTPTPAASPSPTPAATPTPCPILGTADNYSSGSFKGSSSVQTSTETIPVYTKSDATGASSDAAVTYIRTTTAQAGGLGVIDSGGTASTTSSLNTVLFTVNVSWTFRGQTYSTSMSTLRAPD